MYLIYGDDLFLIDKQKEKIINSLGKNNSNGIEVKNYSWIDDDLQKIYDDAVTFTIFDEKKIIVITEAYFLTTKKAEKAWINSGKEKLLGSLIEIKNSQLELIFILNEDKISSKSKLNKKIIESSDVFEVKNLNENQLENYISNYFSKHNKNIDFKTIKYLLKNLPNDLTTINNEIIKLVSLDQRTISIETIDQNLTFYKEADIFELSDFFIANDTKSFINKIRIYDALNDNFINLIALLGSNIAFVRDCLILRKQHKTEAEISSHLNAHPYRVKITLKKHNNLDIFSLNDKILVLYNLNGLLIKGKINFEVISELELIKIMERGK